MWANLRRKAVCSSVVQPLCRFCRQWVCSARSMPLNRCASLLGHCQVPGGAPFSELARDPPL